jgi:poly(3-hydroxybutyrate) depolymerase
MLVACSAGDVEQETASTDAVRSPSDCSAALVPGADRRCTITVDGQQRELLVYAPPNWDAHHPSALVVDAHGAQETAGANAGKEPFFDWPTGLGSGWRLLADREGFVVVQPQGIGNGWSESDADFMLQIPAWVAKTASIDPKRTYMTGISNGAELTYWTACRDTTVYRAFAPVAGFGIQHCPLTHPAPIIHLHAPTDKLVSLAAGESAFGLIRQADHCPGTAQPSWSFGGGASDSSASCLAESVDPSGGPDHWQLVPCDPAKPATTCQTWGPCNGGSEATFCQVAPDMDHHFDQFGGHVLYFNGTSLSLAAVAWRFFQQLH